MKKTGLIILTLILTMLMHAAVYGAAGFTFTVDTLGDVNAGESITVPISVNGNPGFNSVGLVLTYDPRVLEITGVSAVESAMPLNSQFSMTTTPGTQWISLVNPGLLDWGGNGVAANVSFNVLANASAGSSQINLNFTNAPDGTPSNAGGTILRNAAAIAGSVNVVRQAPPVTDAEPFDDAPTPDTVLEPAPTPPTNVQPAITPGPLATQQPAPTQMPAPTPASDPQVTSVPLFDGSEFTGVPYTPAPALSEAPATVIPTATPRPATDFGPVPQTGVATHGTLIAALVACMAVTAVLWGCVLLRKKKRREPNGNG
jgi:hypothetical protein